MIAKQRASTCSAIQCLPAKSYRRRRSTEGRYYYGSGELTSAFRRLVRARKDDVADLLIDKGSAEHADWSCYSAGNTRVALGLTVPDSPPLSCSARVVVSMISPALRVPAHRRDFTRRFDLAGDCGRSCRRSRTHARPTRRIRERSVVQRAMHMQDRLRRQQLLAVVSALLPMLCLDRTRCRARRSRKCREQELNRLLPNEAQQREPRLANERPRQPLSSPVRSAAGRSPGLLRLERIAAAHTALPASRRKQGGVGRPGKARQRRPRRQLGRAQPRPDAQRSRARQRRVRARRPLTGTAQSTAMPS